MLKYEEKYETCIFMARFAHYVIGAFETENYNQDLYKKIDKILTRLDSNKKAKGFIGPQIPCRFILKLIHKNPDSKFAFGFLWMKGIYTKNPHKAYQEWCRELHEACFTKAEIDEINRISEICNNGYDEIGSKAWRMLKNM